MSCRRLGSNPRNRSPELAELALQRLDPCQRRDVLLVQRDRLYDALVDDTPPTHPMHRDDRPVLAHYNEQDPAVAPAYRYADMAYRLLSALVAGKSDAAA